jgi:Trk-type K+ transport system membrane component
MNFGIADHVAASKLLDFEYWSKIKRLLMIIIVVTVFFEVLGTAILYPLMRQHFGPDEAFFNALFFAISAFCNAGISPIGQEIYQFTNSYLILSTLGLLVFAGSLGFFVWQDLFFLAKRKLDSKHTLKKVPILSLHSKIALTTSFLLVIAATFLFWFFERGQTLSALPAVGQWVNAWFNATALRCSGFTTLNYQQVAIPTKLIALFLMMIGANPVSTGSGIKTTTVALTFATLMSTIRNKAYVEIFGRTIPTDLVNKSLSLIVLSFGWVSLSTFVLCMTDPHLDLFGIFFESVASFSTCGITAGITEQLSDLGKSMLIANMIVGRVGILTLLFAFARRTESQSYRYPQERILIG